MEFTAHDVQSVDKGPLHVSQPPLHDQHAKGPYSAYWPDIQAQDLSLYNSA